ncbi:MAG: PilZ domain-containing protein [Clostridiales bacterium]|jgi:c-di-GMP-binding flagellar brake protein YcgR|nr:PilZ domain-containing protein [Clostridiales bacterium]
MAKKNLFEINQKINVVLVPDGEYHLSSIQEIDEKTLSITMPIRRGMYLLLKTRDTVRVEYAVQDAVYSFQANVLDRKRSNEVMLIVLERPSAISRTQRRNYVRFPVNLPIFFQVVGPDGYPLPDDVVRQGKTVDISGGGLQIVTMSPPDREDTVFIKLKLDDNNPRELQLSGDVSWVVQDDWSKNTRFGVSFTDISEVERERIISYIFLKMRTRTQI